MFFLALHPEHMYDGRVLERLEAAIDEDEIPTHGDGLIKAFRLLDRLTARITQAVGEFDADGERGHLHRAECLGATWPRTDSPTAPSRSRG